jgi:hypothetical protein
LWFLKLNVIGSWYIYELLYEKAYYFLLIFEFLKNTCSHITGLSKTTGDFKDIICEILSAAAAFRIPLIWVVL